MPLENSTVFIPPETFYVGISTTLQVYRDGDHHHDGNDDEEKDDHDDSFLE